MKMFMFLLPLLALFNDTSALAEESLCTLQLFSTTSGQVLSMYQDADCARARGFCLERKSGYPKPANMNGDPVDCKPLEDALLGQSATEALFFKGQPVDSFTSTRYNSILTFNFATMDAKEKCENERRARILNPPAGQYGYDWETDSVCISIHSPKEYL